MDGTNTLKDVVIPVAGLGSRMMPLTLAVPKNLLPVGDKTLIQYAVEEAVACGAERIHLICSPAHIEMYKNQFRATHEVQELLHKPGKQSLASKVNALTSVWGRLNFIAQEKPLGLGHAVLQAKPFVQGTFGVILPDDLILTGTDSRSLSEMRNGPLQDEDMAIAAMEVSDDDVKKYGNFDLCELYNESVQHQRAKGIVEKPEPEDAKSPLAALGRYILPLKIMETLETVSPGAGGEIQLTDAIDVLCRQDVALWAVKLNGRRMDCGDMHGYMHAQHYVTSRKLGLD